jgi:transposase
MKHLKKSRLELFLELDKPALMPLPATQYEFAEWKKVKLNIDYHIEFDDHLYSAAYHNVGKELMARATSTVVEIFLKGERIASHRRSYYKRTATTVPEHMPEHHKAMVKWPPSRILSWAKSLGPCLGQVIEKILTSRVYPEQGYRSSLGIIRLEKKYGIERLEKACQRALELDSNNYKFISNMLKNNMDKLIIEPTKAINKGINETNTRGAKYYH